MLPAVALAVIAFIPAPTLEPAASYVAQKPAQVMCAASYVDWNAWLVENGRGEANGTATVGGTVMYLSPDACRFLRDRQRGRPVALYSLGASILVLTHESIHMRGERDEGRTDCAASHEMVTVAQRFFGVKKRTTLRALMANVAKYRSHQEPAYRAVC